MAFRVLNEDELALLTEHQIRQYENELHRFRERSAFVMRMEQLENAEIPAYEPRLQQIALIDGILQKEFLKSEYTVEMGAPVAKPEPVIPALAVLEEVHAVLPEHTKAATVEIDYIKVETNPSKLPKVIKPAPAERQWMPIERMEPVLAERVSPNVPEVSFSMQKNPKVVLPETAVALAEVKPYKKVEQTQIQLPDMDKPDLTVKVQKIEPAIAVLPKGKNPGPVSVEFFKPEIEDPKLPIIGKPDVAVPAYHPVAYTASDMPSVTKLQVRQKAYEAREYTRTKLPPVDKPQTHQKPYRACEYKCAKLPSICKPQIRKKTYEAQKYTRMKLPDMDKINMAEVTYKPIREYTRTKLPAMNKIHMAEAAYKPVKRADAAVTAPEVSITIAKPFSAVDGSAKGLPGRIDVDIPNARERLRELLSGQNSREALEESSS